MSSVNKWIGVGRLGQDPEKRITPNGKSVVNVSLATQSKKDSPTQWHRLVFWGKLADIIEQYCKKGSMIYVEGEVEYREWEDKEGVKKLQTNIVCWQMQMLDSKKDSQQGYQQSNQDHQNAPNGPNQSQQQYNGPQDQNPSVQPQQGNDDFIEDDIPF